MLDPYTGHALAMPEHLNDLRTHPDVGTRLGRGIGEDRVEKVTTEERGPADIVESKREARRDPEVVEPHVDLRHEAHAGLSHRLEHTEPLQEQERVRLHEMRRECLLRKLRLLDHGDSHALACEQCGERRSGTASAHDDHVVVPAGRVLFPRRDRGLTVSRHGPTPAPSWRPARPADPAAAGLRHPTKSPACAWSGVRRS